MTKSTFDSDRRGVSEVIGSILVFGLVVALVSMLQVQAIPNANEEVEFEHNNRLTSDMADLRVAMSQSLDSGRTKEANVQLGVDYPARFLFFNPPGASGTLRTTEQGNVTIEHATGSGNLGRYLQTNPQLATRSLNYSISYNEHGSSPDRVREPAVYYEAFDDETLVRESTFIDGREITFVAIGGEFSANGVTADKVAAKPLSAPMTERTIRGEGSKSINISVPTKLSKEKWDEILADEYSVATSPLSGDSVPGDGYVRNAVYTNNAATYNTLTVTMEPSEEYTLRAGKVGFGTGGEPTAKYLVPVGETPGRAVVEVRDEFNNPVANQEVTVDAPSGTTIRSGSKNGNTINVTTGPDGRIRVVRENGTASSVTFKYDLDADGNVESIENVTGYFTDGVVLDSVTGDTTADTITLTLENRDISKRVTSMEVEYLTLYDSQLNITIPSQPGKTFDVTKVVDGPDVVNGIDIAGGGSSSVFTATEATGPTELPSPTLLPPTTTDVELSLDSGFVMNSAQDSLAVRVTLSFDDGTSETYDVQLFANEL